MATCLINRGIVTTEAADAFLDPRLRSLSDPMLLPDIRLAIDRLFLARERNEPLVIFGDYDVDGVTSTAILTEVLTTLGWQCSQYLPHRRDEGYGLSQAGVENCLARHPTSLLLAVDCGSTAVDPIGWLNSRGVDVLVLDHHQLSDPLPPALALVNPLRSPNAAIAPFCSAGLAFKLAHALVKHGRESGLVGFDTYNLKPLLDLVALGTIADLVPLIGENRILVHAGLERLDSTSRVGLQALKRVSRTRSPMGVYEVGFQLGPRLNAAGRLETAEDALRLLLCDRESEAQSLAEVLDLQNRERQEVEKRIAQEAGERVRNRFDPERDLVIVEGDASWHIGVVGIVASRVLREFQRPTLILGGDGTLWRGSGRSISGFDLAGALRDCSDLLEKHGGHAMAAGLSIDPARLEAFRLRINDLARERLRPEHLQPEVRIDASIPLRSLSLPVVADLRRLEPFGMGNPVVQLAVRGLSHARPPQRLKEQHWKFWVTDGGTPVETVWWGAGDRPVPEGRFDLAVIPEAGDYGGRRFLQLRLIDWKTSDPA
ncbi:MAG: single-stranded-DNA-specific exonuclease RecJ [Verrucomicrobia bacterium]|nr:single-stranded-DNA-specific exonuclease RecJ [Verrucomicrobiota bacterium]